MAVAEINLLFLICYLFSTERGYSPGERSRTTANCVKARETSSKEFRHQTSGFFGLLSAAIMGVNRPNRLCSTLFHPQKKPF